MRGDNALCSSAALINPEYLAKIRGQFCDEKAKRGRGFKSTLLHISVSKVSEMVENRSKSARVRAIFDQARTQRASFSGRFAQIAQFLSRRDLPRSADHRRTFAPQIVGLDSLMSDRCGWLFIDDSKNASRRWCSMQSCGNRAKALRHYLRSKNSS